MKPGEVVRIAGGALLRNKTRSFLTALGIIIGVAAVIAMVAIGEGAKARVEQSFAAMGTNVLVISSGSKATKGARGAAGSSLTLTWDDLDAIADVPDVTNVAPRLHAPATLVVDDRNWSTTVMGTRPAMFDIRRWPMRLGGRFADEDVDGGAKVVVLGQTVAEQLFGASADPIGAVVRINNIPFEVRGVAASKGQSQGGNDYDDVVFVPATTFMSKLQAGLMQRFIPGTIVVGVASDDLTTPVAARITALLRERHRLAPGGGAPAGAAAGLDDDPEPDDFTVKNLTETADRKQESTDALTLLLASIAAVSLLVGGIGIMNIMLVSVTERTREIGVRVAVGAKPRHILLQFLAESLVLALVGGIGGVALGLAGAHHLAARFDWPMLVRPDVVAIAVGFSGAVGVIFGIYPARKAARLDPITALRWE